MFGIAYVVRVSNDDPFQTGERPIEYRFPSGHRAWSFALKSMGMGHFVTVHQVDVPKIIDPIPD